jgi:hypothetical protein
MAGHFYRPWSWPIRVTPQDQDVTNHPNPWNLNMAWRTELWSYGTIASQ